MHLAVSVLALTISAAISTQALGEELTVRIVKQFGFGGPTHNDTYHPGEYVYFRALVDGLESDKAGEVSVRFQCDLRDSDDRPIADIADVEASHRPTWADGRFTPCGAILVPMDAAGKELVISVVVTDKLADKKTTARSRVSVRADNGLVPVNLKYSTDAEGRATSAGRFVEGDGVYLHFGVGGVQSLKPGSRANCSLTFFEHGERLARLKPIEFSFLGTAVNTQADTPIPLQFRFTADRAFKGFMRLTVRSIDEEEGKSVDIPLEVTSQ